MSEATLRERVKALEVLVDVMTKQQIETNQKLDQLLHLRSKGQGAFWVASAIFGTGIVGTVMAIIEMMKGH